MQFLSTALILLASAGQAFAHYRFTKVIANGQTYPEFQYIRKWDPIYNNGPVTDVLSNDIRCNTGGAINQGPNTEVLKVAAGSTIGFAADTTVSHPGPFTAYLAKAPNGDVKSFDGSGSSWFKIWEKGATYTNGAISWDDKSTQWTFALPSGTPSGQYLLRIEHIGLHGASSPGGAQFYISCAQIEVTNGGSGSPSPLVALPGAYSPTDPSIMLNIYYPVPQDYKPPGPAAWRG